MNPHNEKQFFHELYNIERELRAKAAADPVQNAASRVAAAIQIINQFQIDADEIAAKKREKAELDAHNARVTAENEKLSSENRVLDSSNDSLKEQIERHQAVLKDLKLQVGLASGELKNSQPRPSA